MVRSLLEDRIVPQTILGIDVGTYSIKLARAERVFGEFTLTEFHEIPLMGHEVLTHEQAATALLTRFFEENPVSFDIVAASLSGLHCASRIIEFPFIQTKKIDSALEFEMENYVPFPIEDLWIDYVLLNKQEHSSKVMAVYSPKAELVKLLNILGQANCDPRYVSAEGVDLANLYLSGLLPPEGAYALLDLGHSKTNLCIMEGSRLKAVRTIAVGGKTITQAVAKAFQLDFTKAEEMKIKKGQLSAFDNSDPLSEVIQKVVDELLTHIKQTLFAFYEKGEKMIEAVYLCGGTSRLAGMDQYISTRLRLNVSPLDVLDYSYTRLPDPEAARPIIAPCMALLFRAVYPSKTVNLNFRRGEFAYKRDIQAITGQLSHLGWLALSVFILGILYFSISLYTLNAREKKMNKSVASLMSQGIAGAPKKAPKGAQEALSFVTSKINESNDRMKKLEGDSSSSSLEIFRLISANLPPREETKLDVDDLNISTDHVRLEGRTVSYEAVDKIKASLEKVSQFKNIQTGNVRKGIQDEIKFSLSFDIGV
jgi:general secretion pathway protein L